MFPLSNQSNSSGTIAKEYDKEENHETMRVLFLDVPDEDIAKLHRRIRWCLRSGMCGDEIVSSLLELAYSRKFGFEELEEITGLTAEAARNQKL